MIAVRGVTAVMVIESLGPVSPIDRVLALDDDLFTTDGTSRLFLVLDDILTDVDVLTDDRSRADLDLFATQRDLDVLFLEDMRTDRISV